VLDHADLTDFDFLGLNTLGLPEKRLTIQFEEDAFCQRLLRLGAKWWPSERRRDFVEKVAGFNEIVLQYPHRPDEPPPTTRELVWLRVGWPSNGGLWVSEFEVDIDVDEEYDNVIPDNVSWLKLARNIDERCQLLRDHFKGKFYKDIGEYDGRGFLKAWNQDVILNLSPDEDMEPSALRKMCNSLDKTGFSESI
jgi:hypothetical protein